MTITRPRRASWMPPRAARRPIAPVLDLSAAPCVQVPFIAALRAIEREGLPAGVPVGLAIEAARHDGRLGVLAWHVPARRGGVRQLAIATPLVPPGAVCYLIGVFSAEVATW